MVYVQCVMGCTVCVGSVVGCTVCVGSVVWCGLSSSCVIFSYVRPCSHCPLTWHPAVPVHVVGQRTTSSGMGPSCSSQRSLSLNHRRSPIKEQV